MIKKFIIGAVLLSPVLALAGTTAGGPNLTNLQQLAEAIGRIVKTLLPIVVGIALLVFFWGLVSFIAAAGDETKRGKARGIMIWGVVALAVMLSVWGFVKFLQTSFGITDT